MDHKERVSEDLNWLHVARDRIQLTDCYENSDKPARSGMFQLIGYRLSQKNSAECFLLDLLLLLFTITANYVPVEPATTHRRLQQLQSLKADSLTLLEFPSTVLRFQTHNLKVADA